jgi:hypothetical protein
MSIVLLGSTSGSCTLQEQAVAGTTTLTLPTFNGTVGLLVSGTVNGGAANPLSGGTSVDFTGIPAGVRRITVMLSGISGSGTSAFQIQIGDAGGIENTGYVGTGANIGVSATTITANSAGFLLTAGSVAANNYSGIAFITNVTGNTWVSSATLSQQSGGGAIYVSSGTKPLSDTLDRIRITTVNGTDTFDAGSINILYE